ncbi:TolC family protein [Bacteroidota bacterium]
MNKIKKNRISIYTIIFLLFISSLFGQENSKKLALEDVLEVAKSQSFQAILAKHRFRQNYWRYRTYKAEFLPSINLLSNVINLQNTIIQNLQDDGTNVNIQRNQNNTDATLEIEQNIGITGGRIFIQSYLNRNDDFLNSENPFSYRSQPFEIGFNQPINGYNSLIWKKRIEPLRYDAAKKTYLQDMENVSIRAINYFFDLALAQVNLKLAEINYANTDTLYKISTGRYNIGTISESELLQMELKFLNADLALNQARLDLEVRKSRLRTFLGFNEKVNIELLIPTDIPDFEIDPLNAIKLANNNNPELLDLERRLLEAEQEVAQSKSEKGINANLIASYGLAQKSFEFKNVYSNPQASQTVRAGIQIPILDWGLVRGKYKMALSALEVERTSVSQSRIDFEQNVFNEVMQFNLQDNQLLIASKADTIAQIRYDVTKHRFLIGKIDVLDLNIALQEKDDAKRSYIAALKLYWISLFNMRALTLYDFEQNKTIDTDFDLLFIQEE